MNKAAACLAGMLPGSGCIEMPLLGCDAETDDCGFASTPQSPATLAAPPAAIAR